MKKRGPCETGFVDAGHDHSHCIARALTQAADLCRRRGARLTPQRQRVLEIVWQTHKPVGAYDILHQLRKEMRAEPPTVYRALEFLRRQGLIHRLVSLNAFVGCSTPDIPHGAFFLICQRCKAMQPLREESIAPAIRQQADRQGFAVGQEIVEILGTCAGCRSTEAS